MNDWQMVIAVWVVAFVVLFGAVLLLSQLTRRK